MASPLPHIEKQLARRAELVRRIEMMRNYLAGANEDAIGFGRNHQDITPEAIETDQAEIADIDARLAQMRDGHA